MTNNKPKRHRSKYNEKTTKILIVCPISAKPGLKAAIRRYLELWQQEQLIKILEDDKK